LVSSATIVETVGGMLRGRVAMVTGAGSGIGAAVVSAFVAAGARCSGVDIKARDDLIACDVTDETSVFRAFDRASEFGPVTDVVHAAGIVSLGRVAETSIAEVRRVLDVNLLGSFVVGRLAAQRLTDGGSVTFLASQAGIKGSAGWSAYCASKAGVMRLAEVLAKELGGRGVRVNAVCPGSVDTPLLDEAVAAKAALEDTTIENVRRSYVRAVPLGRLATPDDIAKVCVFLASGLASFVSGASILVDGGELD